jgi:hypothetical protein
MSVIGRKCLKGVRLWKSRPYFLKQPGLAELARIIKASVIVGKDMRAMLAAQPIKGFTTPLRENNGLGPANGGSILIIWQPASTQDVRVGHDVRMK